MPTPARAQTFNSSTTGASLRVVLMNGEARFVATDACFSLGLRHVARAMRSLTPVERDTGRVQTHGGRQLLNLVTLDGLEALASLSQRPNAAEVLRWVHAEVLPALRDAAAAPGASTEPLASLNADAAPSPDLPAPPAAPQEPEAPAVTLTDALRPVVALLGELAGGVAEVRARLGWLEASGAATARHLERIGGSGPRP